MCITPIGSHNVTMIMHFVPSQLCQCTPETTALLPLAVYGPSSPRHPLPLGDKMPGEVWYHTTHHLVCKAAWEVLLEGPRRCYWFIATTYCHALCSIHFFIVDPLKDRLKVSIYYKRCCQLFLDVGETGNLVLCTWQQSRA